MPRLAPVTIATLPCNPNSMLIVLSVFTILGISTLSIVCNLQGFILPLAGEFSQIAPFFTKIVEVLRQSLTDKTCLPAHTPGRKDIWCVPNQNWLKGIPKP